jgi:long-chain acyl-CoA synthetase
MSDRRWLAHYPSGVPHSLEPYPETSVYSLFSEAAARHPDRPAWVFAVPGAPMWKRGTYRELLAEVEQFSRALYALGVRKGDRVALVLPNCPQFAIGFFAALRIGAIVVGTNPLYTERELSHQLSDAGVEVAVVLEQLYPGVAAVRDQVGLREVVVTRVADYLPFPVNRLAPMKMKREAKKEGHPWPPVPEGEKVTWWKPLMRERFPFVPEAEIDPREDVAGFVYTGGTTGLSKGAVLTHHNLVANVTQCVSWFPGLRDGAESGMCITPLFHSLGMTVALLVGTKVAAKAILQPIPDMPTTLRAIKKEKPTLFPGVPRLYIALNEHPDTPKYDLSSIRACFSGAAALPLAVREKFERMTGGTIVEGYGLTETSPVTHGNPIEGLRKEGSIGLPIPDTDCRIVDADDWTKELPQGEVGEIAVAGPQVMKEYWNRPEQTDDMIKTDADGTRWLLTGDLGRMDEDGYFYVVDRKKDMIIVSGFNVYPTEIEEVLYRHPSIEKVCVVGIPDETTGEAVKAFIVLRKGQHATEEDILEFCRDPVHGLTGYRVPKFVEFRASLPETMVGKVLRRALRDEQA